ncbi:unnamed protein product [Nippostrongylus brasiliensis]|uniref:GD_AH_C domain-containing protein n=1 Tax=Nippostrongylus brasiliensis TaxID=27835 RepID=A0A0N4Y6U2_NIPBR|nr:unnamed protein product [Nippostrongylus brasiliensis]
MSGISTVDPGGGGCETIMAIECAGYNSGSDIYVISR